MSKSLDKRMKRLTPQLMQIFPNSAFDVAVVVRNIHTGQLLVTSNTDPPTELLLEALEHISEDEDSIENQYEHQHEHHHPHHDDQPMWLTCTHVKNKQRVPVEVEFATVDKVGSLLCAECLTIEQHPDPRLMLMCDGCVQDEKLLPIPENRN